MAVDTDVCNEALAMNGQGPITSLDQGTTNANRCKLFYQSTVDAAIRAHRWGCAKFFAELLPVEGDPPFKWDHAYRLPADPYCLRVWELNECQSAIWTLGGNRLLLTNEASAEIEYAGRVVDPTNWDALLYQVIVHLLASKLAVPIHNDIKKSQGLYQIAQAMMGNAMTVDSQEGSAEVFESPDLLNARGG